MFGRRRLCRPARLMLWFDCCESDQLLAGRSSTEMHILHLRMFISHLQQIAQWGSDTNVAQAITLSQSIRSLPILSLSSRGKAPFPPLSIQLNAASQNWPPRLERMGDRSGFCLSQSLRPVDAHQAISAAARMARAATQAGGVTSCSTFSSNRFRPVTIGPTRLSRFTNK